MLNVSFMHCGNHFASGAIHKRTYGHHHRHVTTVNWQNLTNWLSYQCLRTKLCKLYVAYKINRSIDRSCAQKLTKELANLLSLPHVGINVVPEMTDHVSGGTLNLTHFLT